MRAADRLARTRGDPGPARLAQPRLPRPTRPTTNVRTQARAGEHASASSRRRSGTAPRVPATRCCTGTCSSPTSSRAPTGGGPRSCTPRSTGTPAPRARCSRPRSGPSSPQSLGVEWRPGRHVPEIAGVPQRVLDAVLQALRRDRGLARRDRHTRHPGRPSGGRAGDPAQQARAGARRPLRRRLEGRSRTLGWGPAHGRRSDRRLCARPAPGRLRRRRGGSRPSASTSTATSTRTSAPSPRTSGSPTCSAAT